MQLFAIHTSPNDYLINLRTMSDGAVIPKDRTYKKVSTSLMLIIRLPRHHAAFQTVRNFISNALKTKVLTNE